MAQTFLLDEPAAFDRLKGAVCALGVFDGVHKGHRAVADRAVRTALEMGVPSAVVTFDVDPDELFSRGSLKKLQSNEERAGMLAQLPVDFVGILPFTCEFAAISPQAFLDDVLGAMKPAGVLVGDDFRFGSKAAGDVRMLSEWGSRNAVAVDVVDLIEVDGVPAKSTRIRGLLDEGDVRGAARLLGRPYSYAGVVRKGRGDGASMGFATANLQVPESRQLPADGVYGGYATVDGVRYKAAVSVGIPPTFAEESRDNVEVHLLGFEGDLYGNEVTVEFVEWLRPMKRFDDVADLVATVKGDIAWIEENL